MRLFPGMRHRFHTFALTVCRAESDRKITWAGRWKLPLLIFGGLLLARKALIYVLAPTCKRQASSESVELARMPFAVKKKELLVC